MHSDTVSRRALKPGGDITVRILKSAKSRDSRYQHSFKLHYLFWVREINGNLDCFHLEAHRKEAKITVHCKFFEQLNTSTGENK